MKKSISGWMALGGIAMLMTACGGGDGGGGYPIVTPQPTPTPTAAKVTVDDLATGSYVVSLGDANAPTIGKYYAAADGSRRLVVSDGNDRAKQVYRRDAGSTTWAAVPAVDKDVQVTLLQGNALPDQGVGIDKLVGSYRTQVGTGLTAVFAIAADGTIAPGSTDCKLSGKVTAGTLPNTLKLTLAASGCGSLPATASGVLAFDSDYAPASFRLLGDDGTVLVDLWAYRE